MGLSFYVVDTETTGFDAKKHEITQISIIRYADRFQLTKWIKIKHPERTSPQALKATGRTYKDLLVGQSAEEVVEACNKFILSDGLTNEHRCIIGHNVSFDMRFCHALWASYGKQFPAMTWLDTKPFAKQWANKLGIAKPKLTLAACLEFTGIKPLPGIHEAASDARNTYLLYKKGLEEGLDHLVCIKRIPHIITE